MGTTIETTDDMVTCPECGVEDAEYSVHERGCPSGYPTWDATDPIHDAVREFEDENRVGPF